MSDDEEHSEVDVDDVDLDIPGESPDDPDMDEWWTWSNFARLFIVPLIIVVVAVFIYGTFQFMIRDQRVVDEYINQMKTGTERSRWRAAFDLAQKVQKQDPEKTITMSELQQIIDLYRNADQPKVRMYLARVLGHIPSPDAREALVDGLDDPHRGVRENTILALGEMEASEEINHLASRLDDEDPAVRRMAAYVLGSLDNEVAIEPLKSTLDDPVEDVRWNGAIAIARLGDSSGEDVLIANLKRAANGQLKSLDDQPRANLLVNSIKAVVKINSRDAVPYLEKIKENDPAPPVREEALKALEALRSRT